jgi:cell fate (sporulation/competence/biofilm development) regulator YlbF (YheA/YmcA/DUF963 family)
LYDAPPDPGGAGNEGDLMDGIQEKAREIGRLVAQSNEYQALKRANQRLGEDRETVTLLNRLADLQDRVTAALQRGEDLSEEQQSEYETLIGDLQGRSLYQSVVAAQENFDRLMMRVNEEIANGIEAGDQSRIILPS